MPNPPQLILITLLLLFSTTSATPTWLHQQTNKLFTSLQRITGSHSSPWPFSTSSNHNPYTSSSGPAAGPRIYDISMPLHPNTVAFASATGLGPSLRTLVASPDTGSAFFASNLQLSGHAGTHVDSPGHFIRAAYHSGVGTEALDLWVLNGPVLVVETPAESNITAAVLEDLKIPQGTVRVIFKTSNTARGLLHKTAFDTSYTALTKNGAEWIVRRGDIKLIGIDYLSIAYYADLVSPHVAILSKGIIPVEGLLLNAVPAGLYTLHCLPLKVVGSDGAPARCILMG